MPNPVLTASKPPCLALAGPCLTTSVAGYTLPLEATQFHGRRSFAIRHLLKLSRMCVLVTLPPSPPTHDPVSHRTKHSLFLVATLQRFKVTSLLQDKNLLFFFSLLIGQGLQTLPISTTFFRTHSTLTVGLLEN